MSESARFLSEIAANIRALREDADVQALSRIWLREITRYKYAYNFSWMGRPIIQFPQDMVAVQEIIWRTGPEVVIETGVAHGGSLVYYASLLALLGGERQVVGVDIDIRAHNRSAIESHPMARHIRLIQGSSTDGAVVEQVRQCVVGGKRTMVLLDSNHTHEHVLQELRLYAPLVSRDCYLIVFDTLLDDMPADLIRDRPWGPGNNPKTALREYLRSTERFEVDRDIDAKLLISAAPEGYLRCVHP